MMNRPQDALKFYEAAQASSIPHLDYEQAIQLAIDEARTALTFIGTGAAGAAADQPATIRG